MESTRLTCSRSELNTESSAKPYQIGRKWDSDLDYIAAQDAAASWSHKSAWGDAAAERFVKYGYEIQDRMFHDDRVADFGGNDGWAAHQFYLIHKVKPLVVDCEPKRLRHAWDAYGLDTFETFLEDMSGLPDKSIDWAFSSHTLEHCRDTGLAMREMARVVKRLCYFILPLEGRRHAEHNHGHCVSFTQPSGWTRLLRKNGWKVIRSAKVFHDEAHVYGVPK